MRSARNFCPILMKTEFSRQIFENTCIKFHENPSSWSRIVQCGHTDGQADMTKLKVAFRSFASEHNKETITIRRTLLRHSVHSLIFLYTSVPHPSQPLTYTFTLPFIFLAVGG